MLYILVAVLVQPPQAPPVVDDLQRLPAIRRQAPAVRGSMVQTYKEGVERALAENRPLIVWTGDARCMPCVKQLDSCLHYVAPMHPSFPAHTITVGVPTGGVLMMADQLSAWPDGQTAAVLAALNRRR